MSKIQIGTTTYYYELHGSGEPLVLISGYTCDHRKWEPLLKTLSGHYQVLIFDNRAVGQTVDNKEDLTIELMADDTIRLIDTLGLKKPYVVGHSMGGNIVQVLAAGHHDKLRKIAILQSSMKWRQAMLNGLKSLILMQKENVSFDTIFAGLTGMVFGENFLTNKLAVEELRESILNDPYPQSIPEQERQFKALEGFNGNGLLDSITLPTLVVTGIEDFISLPHETENIANSIIGAKLVKLACGHDAINECPQELARVLLEFDQKGLA